MSLTDPALSSAILAESSIYDTARGLHGDRLDRFGGLLIDHAARAADLTLLMGGDRNAWEAALLHPSIEFGFPLTELLSGGVCPGTLPVLAALTKHPGITTETYLRSVRANESARIAKIADILDDFSRSRNLPQQEEQDFVAEYRIAERILLGPSNA